MFKSLAATTAAALFASVLAAQAGAMISLAGSEWSYAGQDTPFVRFASDGTVTGNGGCNTFRGRYSQDGTSVRIGPLAATRKACIGDRMAREQDFFKLLDSTRSVAADHLQLDLLGEDGSSLASLQRRDWD